VGRIVGGGLVAAAAFLSGVALLVLTLISGSRRRA